MRCEEFRRRLPEYANGELGEPLFGAMVDHEADCPECRRLTCELQAAPTAARETGAAEADRNAGLIERILARTTGEDCLYHEQRLAERMEEPLSPDIHVRLERHLEECASCRRVRDLLEELPSWYGALSVLRAGPSFRREVLRRTLPAEPGFLEVLRALWSRPEAIWEAAVACALISVLLFGRSVPRYDQVTQRAQQVLVRQAGMRGLGESVADGAAEVVGLGGRAVSHPLRFLRGRWEALQDGLVEVSNWLDRTGDDLRAGDTHALLRDAQIALKPLGILPDSPRTAPERSDPSGRTREEAP